MSVRLIRWSLGGEAVKLSAATVADSQLDPTDALAGITFKTDGALEFNGNSAPSDPSDEWHIRQPESGVGSGYEIRLTVSSGDSPNVGASTGTWLVIDSNRVWGLQTDELETLEGDWLVEIRDVTNQVVRDSATFTVQASRTL